MKQQPLEQQNNFINNWLQKIIIPALAGIIILFNACEKGDIEKINTLTKHLDAPSMAVENTEIIYSEEATIKIKITSPEINRYLEIKEPYSEFPKGLHVQFYDSTQTPTSSIRANFAIYNEEENIWTAENNVVAINAEGDTLNTEYLVWDMNKKKVFSDRFVRIVNKDGIIHGTGFESNQDLSNWKIKKTSGTINIENEK
ncbi:MAG TPA: LPS export ABC transporter periplasmic protein LptC [Bacteroidales bacterium]|nr:LPS export ABC transporter periplasmic protein LptC [Bacteroidales bacterium]